MAARQNMKLRCDGSGVSALQMPDWLHDEPDIIWRSCGESLGTIRQLRKLLTAALADEPGIFADNDK
jgi:hypothetical protein